MGVVMKIGRVRRNPREPPAHPLLERFNLRQRRPRNGHRTFRTSAVKPPVEITLASTIVALAMHAGHITFLFPRRTRSSRTRRFRPLPYALMDKRPALRSFSSVVVQNQSKRRVMKSEQCSSIFLAQAVLHIRDHWIGHEQRPRNLEQRRPLDGLHNSPKVAIVVPQVAIPPAARPRLELHRHRSALRNFIVRPQLFHPRRERVV